MPACVYIHLEKRPDGWHVEVSNRAGNHPACEKGQFKTRTEAFVHGSSYLAWLEALEAEEQRGQDVATFAR